ncbi:hypothetical protein BH18ACT1_BH18ACT1_01320 [soil metagenome]|nr:redoxin domain-containing protein [Acidimicrobiia bacterium]
MAVGIGDPAPEIVAVDADGGTWRLSSFRAQGRPVVLVFHRHLA